MLFFLPVAKRFAQHEDTGLVFYYKTEEQQFPESYLNISLQSALSVSRKRATLTGSELPAPHSSGESAVSGAYLEEGKRVF